MIYINRFTKQSDNLPCLGLDIGVFAVKGVLADGDSIHKIYRLAAGNPALAAKDVIEYLLKKTDTERVNLGITGNNARLVGGEIGAEPVLEVEALQAGLAYRSVEAAGVLSLGHENMYYLEMEPDGTVSFFNRNGQCAAGSGSFWYQQATRMGYNDRELAEVAVTASSAVKISGRCAVFAKSDMTHAINEGASQVSVAAGMAKALVDLVVTGVAQNRINGPARLITMGGVANNRAIIKYLTAYCRERQVEVEIPPDHEYITALGAALRGVEKPVSALNLNKLIAGVYTPDNPLPALDPARVYYDRDNNAAAEYDFSLVYIGVDCGSVSTKCALLDGKGRFIGGVYLPTSGRPALQVLELMKKAKEKYGSLFPPDTPVVTCTTGSGRFLAKKILSGEYAVDEITCQAEGVKSLYGDISPNEMCPGTPSHMTSGEIPGETLSIIEIGGEDSKYIQIKNGVLFDYNMNPVCAAGTGTFLENLAELLGVKIKEEFSEKAFRAEYAIDLGDTCTLLSQSTLVSAASRGLPLEAQLASLAYSSARNYLSRTVENRKLEGKLIFTGATAKNHALAAAFAAECGQEVFVPSHPELTGALGAALVARIFYQENGQAGRSAADLGQLNDYTLNKKNCRASCPHEHNCQLDVIKFADGSSFIYGDRCGRYSEVEGKKKESTLPDYQHHIEEAFRAAAGEPLTEGPEVGIAGGGLYFELYPFWAAFFRTLGARVVLSGPSNEQILEQGKMDLSAEMCYPVEVLVGHYRELVKKKPDYIFIPEVINLPSLPWVDTWSEATSCPLLQMTRGVVVHSLQLPEEQVLYAQLHYSQGPAKIRRELLPVARKLLGNKFSPVLFMRAVEEGYRAWEKLRITFEEQGCRIMETLATRPAEVVALILGRSYTLYDPFVSKNLISYAGERGLFAFSQDFFLEYLIGWYEGRIKSGLLEPRRREFESFMTEKTTEMGNIYPAQLQRMISAALAAQFFNDRLTESRLPQINLILQDPFRCGPNSMLRHYLDNIAGYLRLTLDEHTAAAGMITRLEAFKNTCRSRKKAVIPTYYSAQTSYVTTLKQEKILVPEATKHAHIFAALFENYGAEAAVLPRSRDNDLTLARRFTNGEECLPFIQNMQDYLEYAEKNSVETKENQVVFFQGWACGPCRYGFYAPTQSLLINRAGYGPRRVCTIRMEDLAKRFGPEFVISAFDGTVAIDMLYKMLHTTRPYEREPGAAEALFDEYCRQVSDYFRTYRLQWPRFIAGTHLKALEEILAGAAEHFAAIIHDGEKRPRIMLAGEFYVRLDDRSNKDIIRQIEAAGGEVFLAPASEFFMYTVFVEHRKAQRHYALKKSVPGFFEKLSFGALNIFAQREEHILHHAAGELLKGQEEAKPHEILACSKKYIPEDAAGEPPMTVGRTIALCRRDRVAGAVFVGPFTCMPASVVEAQQEAVTRDTGLPIITVYYDGRDNTNREEFIQSLVFQAKQKLARKKN